MFFLSVLALSIIPYSYADWETPSLFQVQISLALGTISYSYADWEAERHADWCQELADELTGYDVVPLAKLCSYESLCNNFEPTLSDARAVLEDDYITQKFLDMNPPLTLDNTYEGYVGHRIIWIMYDDRYFYPKLIINFDQCANLDSYVYKTSESEQVKVRYPIGNESRKNLDRYNDDRYEIIKTILGRHPPPDIQVSEFGKPLDETNCNGKDHELYVRNGDSLICASPQAHAMMVERGLDVRHPPPDETNCNGKDHELYVRNGDSLICASPQAYAMMVERGLDVRPA